jgi:UDP-N-acetylglucosamine--N-acetylmuramyl-(pentapeptide) pyrophosphoryl-undecaprenol N-acetylglucosamine transferase
VKIVVSAGGTAGHVNPALAVTRVLIENGAEVLYAGTPDSFEERLVTAQGIPFTGFYSKGFNRRKPWTLPATLLKLNKSRSLAKEWLKEIKADAVATFGGYASLPVGLAATSLGLPLLVHEQNARSGLANRLLAGKASVLAVSDERAISGFSNKANIVVTGNPLRDELFGVDRAAAREFFGVSTESLVMLVFGGSTGAHHLNAAILDQAQYLLETFPELEVIHVTGSLDYEWANEVFSTLNLDDKRWQLHEYCYNMGEAYAAADLIVARAGATSLAEFTALGKPALLVPYPYAAADEQTANAERLAAAGAARVWVDSRLDEPGFADELTELLANSQLRAEMAEQAAKLGKPEATATIAKLVLELTK